MVHGLDGVEFGVGPVDGVGHGVVHGDGGRPGKAVAENDSPLASVHPGNLNLWRLSNVCPVHAAMFRIQSQSNWLLQIALNHRSPVTAVSCSNRNFAPCIRRILALVKLCPIEVGGDPVVGNSQWFHTGTGAFVAGRPNRLRMANLGVWLLWRSGDERPLDFSLLSVGPIDHHDGGIEVDADDPVLVLHDVEGDVTMIFGLEGLDVLAGGEYHLDAGLVGLAHSAELVAQRKSTPARASVGPVHVGADVRAVVAKVCALIHVEAALGVVGIDDVTSVAQAKVATSGQIVAPVLASASASVLSRGVLTRSLLVAALLVGSVAAVVFQVADLVPLNALAVGALEVGKDVGTGSGAVGAEGHVVLVAAVAAVVLAVAHLELRDALVVVALELLYLVTGKVF